MALSRLTLVFLAVGFNAVTLGACFAARAQSPAETTPPEHKRTDSHQSAQQQPALEQQRDQTAPLVDQQAQK
jgi:hypothetical protein